MCAFEKIEVSKEREIESSIVKTPEQLEDGLRVLAHQVQTDRGPLDILAIDPNDTLVVIEIKRDEATTDALIQTLEYYDWVFENRTALAHFYSKKARIDIYQTPRIVLVADSFSPQVITTAKHVRPPIELKMYVHLQSKEGEKGFFFTSIEIPIPKGPPPRPTTEADHIGYITNKEVQQICRDLLQKIKEIGDDIELKPTEYYLACQFNNRNFALFVTRRDFFHVHTADWSDSVRIEHPEDFTPEWFEKIKQDFVKIGGKLKS